MLEKILELVMDSLMTRYLNNPTVRRIVNNSWFLFCVSWLRSKYFMILSVADVGIVVGVCCFSLSLLLHKYITPEIYQIYI